jgi:hypothetical protein
LGLMSSDDSSRPDFNQLLVHDPPGLFQAVLSAAPPFVYCGRPSYFRGLDPVDTLKFLSRGDVDAAALSDLLPRLWTPIDLIPAALTVLLRALYLFFWGDSSTDALNEEAGTLFLWPCRASRIVLEGPLLLTDSEGRVPWLVRAFSDFTPNFPDFVPPCDPYWPDDWYENTYDDNKLDRLNWEVAVRQVRVAFANLSIRSEVLTALLAETHGLEPEDAEACAFLACNDRWPEYCRSLAALPSEACSHILEPRGLLRHELVDLADVDLGDFCSLAREAAEFRCWLPCCLAAPPFGFDYFERRLAQHAPPLLALPACFFQAASSPCCREFLCRNSAALAALVAALAPAVRSLPQL